jgi:vacuolar protein sorting-associated protein 26
VGVCLCVQNYLIGAFGPPCSISIDFADAETRKQASVKKENGQTVLVPLFLGNESVVGEVSRSSDALRALIAL